MASLIELDDLEEGYLHLLREVTTHGRPTAPRGQRTTEVTDATIVLRDPRRSVPHNVGRKLNFAIGMAETCHLIGGLSDAAQMTLITQNFAPFVQADALAGAYGPRLRSQIPRVVRLLAEDPDSRQAVLNVWDPHRDWNEGVADRPCTVSLQFRVRDELVELHTSMRSNDLWLGLPYDAWMFTRLQFAVAWALGRRVGPYSHTAGSLHLYDRDRKKLNDLHLPRGGKSVPTIPLLPSAAATPKDPVLAVKRWEQLRDVAANAALGRGAPGVAAWYARGLDEYVSGNELCDTCHYVLPRKTWFAKSAATCRACRTGLTHLQYERAAARRA